MRRGPTPTWRAGLPQAPRSSSRDPFHGLPEILTLAAQRFQIVRHHLEARGIIGDSLPGLRVTKLNMRDGSHPRRVIERTRMHSNDIRTGTFLAGNPAAAIVAKPERSFDTIGTGLAPEFSSAAAHDEVFSLDQH